MSPNDNPFPITESELVHRLGIPRSTIRSIRKSGTLVEGLHWALQGREIRWTDCIEHLRTLLSLPPAEKLAPNAIEELTVKSRPAWRAVDGRFLHFRNPRVIAATRQNGDEVIVRVPDSSKFTQHLQARGPGGALVPMTFKARRGQDGWTLAQPAPRWTGRW